MDNYDIGFEKLAEGMREGPRGFADVRGGRIDTDRADDAGRNPQRLRRVGSGGYADITVNGRPSNCARSFTVTRCR